VDVVGAGGGVGDAFLAATFFAAAGAGCSCFWMTWTGGSCDAPGAALVLWRSERGLEWLLHFPNVTAQD